MEKPATEYIFIGFLALLAWLPLPLGSNRPWAMALMEIWACALMMIWLWHYFREALSPGVVFLKARPALVLLFLWLAYSLIQFLPLPYSWVSSISLMSAKMHALAGDAGWITLSVDPHDSLSSWLESLAYVLIFCLSLLLVNTGERLKKLAYVIIYSGLFQAFYGAFMTLSGFEFGFFLKKFSYMGNATGTFVNRNHLAGYLELCLSVGIGLMMASLGGKTAFTWRQKLRNFASLLLGKKLRLRLYLAIMVIALVLTHSRMGNSAFFSSMIAAGIIGLMLSRHAPRSTVILLASLVVIDIFIVGTWFGMEKVVDRIENTSAVHDADRVNVSENTVEIWKDYLLTGSGGGSFYAIFPKYRAADVENYYDHAHDDYAELGSEYGVIGMLLLGALVVSSFFASLFAQYRRRNPLMRGMAFSSTMGIIALMMHSFVDFNLHIPANAAIFMVILSLSWISLHLKSELESERSETV